MKLSEVAIFNLKEHGIMKKYWKFAEKIWNFVSPEYIRKRPTRTKDRLQLAQMAIYRHFIDLPSWSLRSGRST